LRTKKEKVTSKELSFIKQVFKKKKEREGGKKGGKEGRREERREGGREGRRQAGKSRTVNPQTLLCTV
jgi:hypothetical protein